MIGIVRSSLHWLGRHALPAVAATLVVGAAAGGGITYAMTSSQPAASAAATSAKPGTAVRARGAPFARQVVAIVVKDTGLSLATIKADLAKGESLDQVAVSNATKLENDIVTTLTTALSKRLPAISRFAPLFTHGATVDAMIRARVHALMAEPGTQLLQQLAQRPAAAAGSSPPAVSRPRHQRNRVSPSPSPSPAA